VTTQRTWTFRTAESFLNRFTNYERVGLPVLKRGDRTRMALLLQAVGDPQEQLPAVHVTGSKGKGSLCLLLEALLSTAGRRVGTYLSPHLECVTERIRIAGKQITPELFAKQLAGMSSEVESLSQTPTYFEILTALAWKTFTDQKVELALIEAGIGAANDATSLLKPVLSIVTSVELEHTNVLGRTRCEILLQKLGAARKGVPLLLGPIPAGLRTVARAEAERKGALLLSWDQGVRLVFRPGRNGAPGRASVSYSPPFPEERIVFPAPSRSFAVNAALAWAAFRLLEKDLRLDPAPIFSSVTLPGRQEFLPGDPPILLDGAHTFYSLKELKKRVKQLFGERKITVLFALSKPKKPKRLLPLVEPFARRLYLLQADAQRGWSPQELLPWVRTAEPLVGPGPEEALKEALETSSGGEPVCVCGSFYLAGRARAYLRRAGRLPPLTLQE